MKEKNKIKPIAIILIFILMFQYMSAIIPFLESIAVEYEFKDENNIEWLYETEVKEDETTIAKNLKPKNKSGLSGKITIPNKVTSGENEYSVISIAKDAFKNCTGVTKIDMKETSVHIIGENAFYGCTGLTSIVLSNVLTSIGESAFYGCNNLTSIKMLEGSNELEKFPGSLTSIGKKAFYGCSSLTKIVLPGNLTEIQEYSFYDCTSLKIIEFLRHLNFQYTGIYDNAFGTSQTREYGRQYIFGTGRLFGWDGLAVDFVDNFLPIDTIWYDGAESDSNIAGYIRILENAYFGTNNVPYVTSYTKTYEDTETGNHYQFHIRNAKRGSSYNPGSAYLLQGYNFADNNTIIIPASVKDGETSFPVNKLGGKNEDDEYVEFIRPMQSLSDEDIAAIKAKNVEISDGIAAIDSNYFKGWNGIITIPDSVASISKDACKEYGENFKIRCNGSSYACKYAVENNIPVIAMCKFNSSIAFERVCAQIENDVNFINYDAENKYFELELEDIKKIKKLDVTNNTGNPGGRILNSGLNDLKNFPMLEELIAENNGITRLTDWLCSLKKLSLKGNSINNKIDEELSNDAVVNLEKLDLTRNSISDLSIFEKLKGRKAATSDKKLEIDLQENCIEDLTDLEKIITTDSDLITVNLKNQIIVRYAYRKIYTVDEISCLFNQLKDTKYNYGEEITYSTENCKIDGENIIISDELDISENKNAIITINNGIMKGSQIQINSNVNSIILECELNQDELKFIPYDVHENRELKDSNRYGNNYAYLKYSINENGKGYGEYKVYNGPIILKYGNNKIKVKLFNNEVHITGGNSENEYEVNIGEELLSLNAVRKNGKVHILSNADLTYSFEKNGNYQNYTSPINNTTASKIYVKLYDNKIKELTIEDGLSEDEYTIYDTKIGNDMLERNKSRYESVEIADVIRKNGKIYIKSEDSQEEINSNNNSNNKNKKLVYSFDMVNWHTVYYGSFPIEIEDMGYNTIYFDYDDVGGIKTRNIVSKDGDSKNHLAEIFAILRDSQKVYSFSQERIEINKGNSNYLLINDENKIKEIDKNITNVTQIYDKILVVKDNNVYELKNNTEFKEVNNGSNIKLINGKFAISNDNSIWKCSYIDGNLQYTKCDNFVTDGTITKVVLILYKDIELPYVLYENGVAKILLEDGTNLEISNRAMDISAINNKVYALEYDKIKSAIDPLDRDVTKDSKKVELTEILQESEIPLKVNTKGNILTNKGNLIGVDESSKRGRYYISYSSDNKTLIFDFNTDKDLENSIKILSDYIGHNPGWGGTVDKESLETFFSENITKNITDNLNEEKYQRLYNILNIVHVIDSYEARIRISKDKANPIYLYINDKLAVNKTNIKRLGDNTYETKDGDIFYEVEREKIENEGSPEENITGEFEFVDVQANKLTDDIKVSKDESKLSEDKVTINIEVPENKYKIKLPDGKEVTKSTSFDVNKNGIYTMEFTDKDGYTAIRVIHVTNIESRKKTKVPVVVAANGKIKLESSSEIEYSIDEKKTWKKYTEELTYSVPIYSRVKDEAFECSIIKITIDNNGKLEVYNEETREIQSKILTNALGRNGDWTIYNDETKVIKFVAEFAKSTSEVVNPENNNIFMNISNIVENIIYSFSVVDGRYAGCYLGDNISEITYKDLDNNVISIDMNEDVRSLSNSNDQIDYAVINDNYKESKIGGFFYKEKTEEKNYAYVDNTGKIVSDLKILDYAKEQIGEDRKIVKIVGDGATFYILTEEGEVYIATEGTNKAECYFSVRLNGKDPTSHPIGYGKLNYYIVYKQETRNIVDIFDTNTALTKDGEVISLLYPNQEETSVVQELQEQTDKYLLASRLGLKDGKLYNFSNIYVKNRRVVDNEINAKTNAVKKGRFVLLENGPENGYSPIAIYSKTNKTIKVIETDRKNTLGEDEVFVGIQEEEGDLPEFIDIAEYRDTFMLSPSISRFLKNGYVDKYDYADSDTITIALSKDGEIYLYVLDSKKKAFVNYTTNEAVYPLDTRTGYVIDTGINLDYYGPSANYEIDNSKWTNQKVNLKLSENTTNEIVEAIMKKDGKEIAKYESKDGKKLKDTQVEAKANGEYTYEIKDKKGRTYQGVVKVGNIDKLKPITPEITTYEGKLKVNFKDDKEATKDYAKSGIKARYISFDKKDWKLVEENETLVKVNENQILYAKTIDNAGNESNIAERAYKAEIGNVVVIYQDLNGNKLSDDVTLSGEVGTAYKAKRKGFEKYELVEVVGNEEGKFQKANQFVIYKYKKIEDVIENGKVIVKYQDENGNSIKDDITLEGKVGQDYKTEKAEFEVYEFVKVEGKEEGKFEKEEQVVIYKYNKKSGRVIIIFNDPDGIKIKENDIIVGKIDTDYKIDRKVIDGYELVEVIGNEQEKFKLADQFVIYKYKKIEKFDMPQTGQTRIVYIAIGIIIVLSIGGLIYIKWNDLKSKNTNKSK